MIGDTWTDEEIADTLANEWCESHCHFCDAELGECEHTMPLSMSDADIDQLNHPEGTRDGTVPW